MLVLPGTGAIADHTDPRNKLSPTDSLSASGAHIEGEGTWSHIRNFRPNPGTDLEIFTVRGTTYATTGHARPGQLPARRPADHPAPRPER